MKPNLATMSRLAVGSVILLGAIVAAGGQGGLAQTSGTPPDSTRGLTTCAPDGAIRYICDQAAPEDLVAVPGTSWVIASSFTGGGIRFIDRRNGTTSTVYPAVNADDRFDRRVYKDCPGPLEGTDRSAFGTHGLALRQRNAGLYTLHLVHHGLRESVEVFTLNLRGPSPKATWNGCVVAPMPLGFNSVVSLPDGGFIVSNFRQRGAGDADARAKMAAGRNNGELWEWHSHTGLVKVPGSDASGANGVEISRDGKWIYMAGWGSQSFERIARDGKGLKRDSVPVGFKLDNIRMAPDGMIYGAGQKDNALTKVIRIDPATLKVTELLSLPYSNSFSGGTIGIPVGKDVWVGAFRGDRIAIFTPDR